MAHQSENCKRYQSQNRLEKNRLARVERIKRFMAKKIRHWKNRLSRGLELPKAARKYKLFDN